MQKCIKYTKMNENINIEEIMKQIREEIKEKGYKESDLSFADVAVPAVEAVDTVDPDEGVLSFALNSANKNVRVDYYRPIEGNGLKKALKKFIRKLVKPAVYHLCVNQETFNTGTVQTLNQLYIYIQNQEVRIAELERRLSEKENI